MKWSLGIVVFTSILCAGLLAADKPKAKKFAAGDKVQIRWDGQTVTAEVTGYAATGWVKLKFKSKSNGIELTPTLPPDQVQPLVKGDKSSKEAAKGGKDKPSPSAGKSEGGEGGAKLRTWSDKSGKFSVKARFVELKDDKVTLEREDGKKVTLSIDKLNDADRKVAEELAAAAEDNPFEPADENPFEATDEPADDATGDKPPAGESSLKLADADWSQVESIVIGEPGRWSLAPDAAPEIEKPASNKPIILYSAVKSKGSEIGPFENVDGLLFDRAHGQACVSIVNGHPGKPTEVGVQRVDLVQGKAQELLKLPAAVKPVDLDPSGRRILARTDMFLTPGRLPEPSVSVWELGEKSLRQIRAWDPQDPDNIHKVGPQIAQFVDANHVITVAFPGKLVLWDVAKSRAVYKFDLSASGVPALSANRKYLAAPVNNGMFVLDALTGKTLGKLSGGDPGMISAVEFRPDGRRLAALSAQRLLVWDLDKGELYRDIYFPTALNATHIDWVAGGYVLLGGDKLIDLERRIVLWQYQHDSGHGFSRGYGELGGSFWYALTSPDRKERGLFRALLPHEEALKAANSLNPEQLLVVKPGAQVSLSVNVQGAPADQQTVTQALTEQLKRLGMSVASGGRLVLQATTETGKTEQVSYRSFGRAFGNETASVTQQISRLKFVEDGKVVWEGVAASGAPGFLQMKEGQSLQDALAPYQKPNLKYFADVKLPEYIARPNEAGAYGASRLTHQGIQAAQVQRPQPGAGGN